MVGEKVLVSGAGGFIGSHLVEELVSRGYCVRAFTHYNSWNRQGWLDYMEPAVKERVEIFSGDIRDPHGVDASMQGIKTVFHLAALIGIPYSYHSPDSYVDTNIKGTLNILQAAKKNNIKRLVHTSTSEIYGTAQYVPITEKHAVNPQSPYAATKAGADFLSLSFYRSFDLPVAVIRPFNAYGPRQSARAVIPAIIVQLLSGDKDIELGELGTTRDFTYVKDTARAFISAAVSEQSVGRVVNVGSNFEISIKDLVMTISNIIGVTPNIKISGERKRPVKSEVSRLWADNTDAAKLLDWSPDYNLERGLRDTIEWFKDKRNLSFYKSNIYNV